MRLNLTTEIAWLIPNLILRRGLILHTAAALHCKTTGIFRAARRCWSTAAAYAAFQVLLRIGLCGTRWVLKVQVNKLVLVEQLVFEFREVRCFPSVLCTPSASFPTEIRNSNVFSGRKQVISKKKKKNVFIPKMSWNPMSVHKNYKNTGDKHHQFVSQSICTPVAPA